MAQPARSLTFTSGDFTLEGVLHLPDETPAAAAVICHPAPQFGGDMDNHVVMALCEALNERGYGVLRFNVRGVGGSQGEIDVGSGGDDTRAALGHLRSLREIDPDSIGLIGYSLGAMAAADAATDSLKALALVSPPLGYGDLRLEPGCPVLVAAGDNDEYAPLDKLRIAGERPGVELKIIADSEHFWHGTQDRLKQPVGEFFAEHFG